MLALQIAAGIVLAAIVLKFWKQSLWAAAGVVLLALMAGAVLWAVRAGADAESAIVVAGGVVSAGALRIWAERSQHPIARWLHREMNKGTRRPPTR